MFKLEAEYIQRCLGKLEPLQESRLVQMKAWVAELQKGKVIFKKDVDILFSFFFAFFHAVLFSIRMFSVLDRFFVKLRRNRGFLKIHFCHGVFGRDEARGSPGRVVEESDWKSESPLGA